MWGTNPAADGGRSELAVAYKHSFITAQGGACHRATQVCGKGHIGG